MTRQYSHEEAEEILQLAVHRELADDGAAAGSLRARVTDEDLVRMADELGISPEVVRASALEWRSGHSEKAERQEFNRQRRAEWMSHVNSYVIVNGFMMAMDFWMFRRLTWSMFPLLGWGIGLAFHTAGTFIHSSDYEAEFEKWREKRRKRLAKQAREGKD